MTILSRIRKWFHAFIHIVLMRDQVLYCPPGQVLPFAMAALPILPTHDEWATILVRESLRRCGGNYKSAALLIGRSEGYVRKVGKDA